MPNPPLWGVGNWWNRRKAEAMAGRDEVVHIGGYTAQSGGRATGIVAARRDPATGELTSLGTVAATASPSFLARHPSRPVLYAVNELPTGEISAWRVADGRRSGADRLVADGRGGAVPPGGRRGRRAPVRGQLRWRQRVGLPAGRRRGARRAHRSGGAPGARGRSGASGTGAHAHGLARGRTPAAARGRPGHRLDLPVRPGRRLRAAGAPGATGAYAARHRATAPRPAPGRAALLRLG